MKIKCPGCGHINFDSIIQDESKWSVCCKTCGTPFDIYLIPKGTKVKFADGKIGIIDSNDSETSETFEDINYYVCPIEFINEKIWSNHYVMLRRNDFEIVKERERK